MKRSLPLFVTLLVLCSFYQTTSLKGVWQYAGGITKGKFFEPPKAYKMQRTYSDTAFDAHLLEDGEKPLKYESGKYSLKPDSCLETQTYSLQSDHMIGKVIRYNYIIRNDTLILKGTLPNGAQIEDYWIKLRPTGK